MGVERHHVASPKRGLRCLKSILASLVQARLPTCARLAACN